MFKAEILGVQTAQIFDEELHYKHNGNTEIHGTHFFKVGENAKLVLTHWLQTIALAQTKQSVIIDAQVLHWRTAALKKVLFSQRVQAIAEVQVKHDGINVEHKAQPFFAGITI